VRSHTDGDSCGLVLVRERVNVLVFSRQRPAFTLRIPNLFRPLGITSSLTAALFCGLLCHGHQLRWE
jgi:hypothetical protein